MIEYEIIHSFLEFFKWKIPQGTEENMIRVVPLRFDTAFKKAFSQPDVFCQFVHDVLGIEIHIDRVQRGYRYLKPIGQVDIEYDLFAEDEDSRIVVEIQHVKERDFFSRFLYYHLIALVEQIKSSQEYEFDRAVYTLVVLTSPSLDTGMDCSVLVNDFSFVNEFKQKVEIYPHQLIFLVPRMVNDETPTGIKEWLELITDSLNEEIDETRYDSPIFRRVIEAIELDNISPEELRRIIDERVWDDALRHEHDVGLRAGIQLGREEGIQLGREEGVQLGREEGVQLGREEGVQLGREEGAQSGRAEGRQQEKEEIALSLLREGLDVGLIVRTTGLPREVIEALRQTI
jgi:predicted transposase/invertase (TIGR01784 family)